jgi:hypothetical protein
LRFGDESGDLETVSWFNLATVCGDLEAHSAFSRAGARALVRVNWRALFRVGEPIIRDVGDLVGEKDAVLGTDSLLGVDLRLFLVVSIATTLSLPDRDSGSFLAHFIVGFSILPLHPGCASSELSLFSTGHSLLFLSLVLCWVVTVELLPSVSCSLGSMTATYTAGLLNGESAVVPTDSISYC